MKPSEQGCEWSVADNLAREARELERRLDDFRKLRDRLLRDLPGKGSFGKAALDAAADHCGVAAVLLRQAAENTRNEASQ